MSKFKTGLKTFKDFKSKDYVKVPTGVNEKERKMFLDFALSVANTIKGI